ncbi:MAG: hypothetical protein NC097_00545 [Clostridium sp.]|nr:hypothetical protein [Prevotella sp.]MCM1428268.1 hypothetical protein [Clostridium sp.]
MENLADEIILAQSALVFYDSENLCTSDCMLNLDYSSRNLGIGGSPQTLNLPDGL